MLRGDKADDGRGADVVVECFEDLLPLVAAFNAWAEAQPAIEAKIAKFDKAALPLGRIQGRHWT